MVTVKPFRGVRPKPEVADKVSSLPYDVINRKEAKKLAEGNPYSFLHVIRSEIDLDDSIDAYDTKVYQKARYNLDEMIENNILIQDKDPVFYIYRQIMNHRVQTGIVGCVSIDDYINDIIKKHEFTRPDKEMDRVCHFDCCNANTEPVFLTYRSNKKLKELMNEWIQFHTPIYQFTLDDGITHIVWIINDINVITQIHQLFSHIDKLYIADGHHRSASAVKVGLKRRKQYPNYTGKEEFNYFLSVIFPDEDLFIMDYNRVVKDLNGCTKEEFLDRVGEKFAIELYKKPGQYKPKEKHTFGMYLENQWYKLSAKKGTYNNNDPVDRLDVSILQNNLLCPILGIEDPRTDNRIDFVGGIRGLAELERRVASDMKIAFSLYPTTIDELLSVADNNQIMPPKSTWFEPKLRSGLFIHRL